MKVVLSRAEWVGLSCVVAAVWYASPLLLSGGAGGDGGGDSGAWDFLYIWDDRENFHDNELIQGPLTPQAVYAMFTLFKINVYEPFGWLLKLLLFQAVGLDSWSVRVVALVLHFAAGAVLAATSAVLLNVLELLAIYRAHGGQSHDGLLPRAPRRTSGRYLCGCCLSALVFFVHPIHVEVVAWPSAQPYTLAGLFSYLALFVYVSATRDALFTHKIRPADGVSKAIEGADLLTSTLGGPTTATDLLSAALYLCGLLSKSVCILLPVSFVLVDLLVYMHLKPLQTCKPTVTIREFAMYVTRKIPSMAITAVFLVITRASNRYGEHRDTDTLSLSPTQRVVKAFSAPGWTLRHMLWPSKLRLHYQLRAEDLSLSSPEYLLSIVVLLSLAGVVVWLWQHWRAPQHLLALVYFVAMLLPVSGLVQHGIVSAGANRYAYLCTAVAVPYGGFVLSRLLFNDTEDVMEELKGTAAAMAMNDCTVGEQDKPERTHPRSTLADNHTFSKPGGSGWSHVTTARYVRGGLLLVTGTLLCISTGLMDHWRNEPALFAYSLRMDPSDWRVLDQYAIHLSNNGGCDADNAECRNLWELSYYYTPMGTLKAQLHRLKLLVALGHITRACEGYFKLLESHPDSCHLHNNVASCLVRSGDLEEARVEFQRALQTPGYENLHPSVARNLKRFEEWVAKVVAAQAQSKEALAAVGLLDAKIMY